MQEKLFEILDFAIEREKEAVEFYQYLQKRAEFTGQREHLKELEVMEQAHVAILENIKKKDLTNLDVPEVKTLKLSEYLEPADDQASLDYASILKLAMKREEKAKNYIGNLQNNMHRRLLLQHFLDAWKPKRQNIN